MLLSSVFSSQSKNIVIGLPWTFSPCICPSNVILSNESCLRMGPSHLFCRLLTVSIISVSVILFQPSAVYLCLFYARSTVHSSYTSKSIFQIYQDGSTVDIRRLNKIYNLTKKQRMKRSSPNAHAMRYKCLKSSNISFL